MSEPGMKLSQEQATEMTEFASNHNLTMDRMKEIMREHYFQPYMLKFKEDGCERAKQTILVVKAQINAYQGSGEDIEGVVVNITNPTIFKSNVGKENEKVGARASIIGIFDIKGEKRLITITAFDEAIENAKSLPLGVPVLLSNVSIRESDQYGQQFSFFDSSGCKELPCAEGFQVDVLTEVEAIYGENILSPDQAKLAVGKDKVVKARVKDVQVRPGKKSGKIFGTYQVYDDSVNDADLKEHPRDFTFRVMCETGLAGFDSGSLCYFIGNITESIDEQYAPSMWANIIVPILPIPRDPSEMKSEMENAKRKNEMATANVVIEEEEEEEVKVVDEDDPLAKWDQ